MLSHFGNRPRSARNKCPYQGESALTLFGIVPGLASVSALTGAKVPLHFGNRPEVSAQVVHAGVPVVVAVRPVWAGRVGPGDVGEIGATEIGTREVGTGEVGTGEIRSSEVCEGGSPRGASSPPT